MIRPFRARLARHGGFGPRRLPGRVAAHGAALVGLWAALLYGRSVGAAAGLPTGQDGKIEMTRSTLAGVYTAAQADKGQATYESTCLGGCHAASDHKGIAFKQAFAGHSVFDLYRIIHTEMPKDDPGSLSPEEATQLVAYLLKMNGLPAGTDALSSDEAALAKIKIELPPAGLTRPAR